MFCLFWKWPAKHSIKNLRNTCEAKSPQFYYNPILHHGLVIVGLPYSYQGQMRNDEITGGSPYGASTIAGTNGEINPTENELEAARFQGRNVAAIASKLAR